MAKDEPNMFDIADLPRFVHEEEPDDMFEDEDIYDRPDYEVGDYVVIDSTEATARSFGIGNEATRLLGKCFRIDEICEDDYAVHLENAEPNFYWNWHDFRPADKDDIATAPKPLSSDPTPKMPAWIKPYNDSVMGHNGGFGIQYMLYRPRSGEIKKNPLTWNQLKERGEKNTEKYQDGWRTEYRPKKGKYEVWVNNNTACWASLTRVSNQFGSRWKGGAPTHLMFKIDLKPHKGHRGRDGTQDMSDHEIIAYTRYAQAAGLMPDDLDPYAWVKNGYASFKLSDYSGRYLYLMLVVARCVHEQQWVVRQTLALMQQGMNFYLAFVTSHYYGYSSTSSHSVFSSYDWNANRYSKKSDGSPGPHPRFLVQRAHQLEKYVREAAPKETALVKLRESNGSFGLQDTLKSIAVDLIDDIKSFDDLLKVKPLHRIKKARL